MQLGTETTAKVCYICVNVISIEVNASLYWRIHIFTFIEGMKTICFTLFHIKKKQ